jgi:hypothetical protein
VIAFFFLINNLDVLYLSHKVEKDESGMNKKALDGITKCDTIKKDVTEE